MSSDKILLTAGCSYTDKNFQSLDTTAANRGGWSMWPELMSAELNLQCVNVAKSGISNDTIFNNLMDAIVEYGDKIDTVAVMWTTGDRIPFFYETIIPLAELHIRNMTNRSDDLDRWMDNRPAGNAVLEFFDNPKFDMNKMLEHCMVSTLRKMYELIQVCKVNNYKLVMAQGPAYFDETPFGSKVDKVSPFINNQYFNQLEKHRDKIIGWPLLSDLGGWDLDLRRAAYQDTTVSEKDYHPNAFGQKIFADLFIGKWRNTYGK